MKKKYFIRGLGAGILFASIIMSVSYYTMTDKEIIKRAEKLGMVMADKDSSQNDIEEQLNKLEETKKPTVEPTKEAKPTDNPTNTPTNSLAPSATVEPTTEPTKEPTVIPTVEPTVAPTVEPTKEPTVAPTVAPTNKPTIKPTQTPQMSIKITKGMHSAQVAKALKKAGVIKDADDFDEYLCNNGYDSKLVIGTYTFEKNEDYKSIAKKITR